MDLLTYLTRSPDLAKVAFAEGFASHWALTHLKKGAHLNRQEEPGTDEFILLEGRLASTICDAEGNEICVGLYQGASVVSPSIARTRDGISLVSIEAKSDALVAHIDANTLTELMIASEPIRNWGNGVLRDELGRKADKEWCLAALGGSDRLAWFRERFPNYEEIFNHALIASFLGVTPVTLSRLRKESGAN